MRFFVHCPCCGEKVAATDPGFTATAVEVEPCTRRAEDGVVSVVLGKSAAYALAYVAPAVAHRDGLVMFA